MRPTPQTTPAIARIAATRTTRISPYRDTVVPLPGLYPIIVTAARGGTCLAAAPDRLALLRESGRALAGVLGREDLARDLALARPALLLGPVDGALEDLLRRHQRERRIANDLVRELD